MWCWEIGPLRAMSHAVTDVPCFSHPWPMSNCACIFSSQHLPSWGVSGGWMAWDPRPASVPAWACRTDIFLQIEKAPAGSMIAEYGRPHVAFWSAIGWVVICSLSPWILHTLSLDIVCVTSDDQRWLWPGGCGKWEGKRGMGCGEALIIHEKWLRSIELQLQFRMPHKTRFITATVAPSPQGSEITGATSPLSYFMKGIVAATGIRCLHTSRELNSEHWSIARHGMEPET